MDFDYEYMAEEIINQIKMMCDYADVPEPHIFSEFGSYTVGESGANFYRILGQKKQNDRETWYMIDSSFVTTLPDTWGKLDADKPKFIVESDATIVAPLIFSWILDK